ncbi:MAG: HD domain-containing protein [Chlamydiota bacterium]
MKASKKIYDPVHRFIHLTHLEHALICTRPFQRLHYIHQLGVTFFVYPGAVHRRFEHSLGVMELATRIYDEVMSRCPASILPSDVQLSLADWLPKPESPERRYWRSILRLSALCHDLGHLPFSHTAEKRLLDSGGHEKWTAKIINSDYLAPIWEMLQREVAIDRNVKTDVTKIALGAEKFAELYPDSQALTLWEKIVSQMLTGDFFGADRIDYLVRDSKCSGLVYGSFDYHQLFEMLQILPSDGKEQSLCLGIEENGIESCEALLLSRHYMYKRLYQYPTVKAYSFHLARFMETIYYDLEEDLDRYIAMTDNEVLAELSRASTDPDHPGHFDAACLYLRHARFHAIPLKTKPSVEELQALRKKLDLPPEQLVWELSSQAPKQEALSFPVLRADGSICCAKEISEISVPKRAISWVFAPAKWAAAITKHMTLSIP